MLVENWMATNVIAVKPDTSLLKCRNLLKEHQIRKVDNPDMKMLGSTANAGEQAAAEQAAAEAAQAEAQQEALAQESQEALEANASDAIAKTCLLYTSRCV